MEPVLVLVLVYEISVCVAINLSNITTDFPGHSSHLEIGKQTLEVHPFLVLGLLRLKA